MMSKSQGQLVNESEGFVHPQFNIGRNIVEHKNADVERPLLNSVIDRFASHGGYPDRPHVLLIRPVLTSPLTHSV